jgi:hypothetical protein
LGESLGLIKPEADNMILCHPVFHDMLRIILRGCTNLHSNPGIPFGPPLFGISYQITSFFSSFGIK